MTLNGRFGPLTGREIGRLDVLKAFDRGPEIRARDHHVLDDTRDIEEAVQNHSLTN